MATLSLNTQGYICDIEEQLRVLRVEVKRLRLTLLSQAAQWESEAEQCRFEHRIGAAWDFRQNAKECRDAAEAAGGEG